MAYAFNEDRSKVDVYTEDEIDAMHIVDKETIDAKNTDQDQRIALQTSRIDTLVDHGTGGTEVREELWKSAGGTVGGSGALAEDPANYDCLELLVGIYNDANSEERFKLARVPVEGGCVDFTYSPVSSELNAATAYLYIDQPNQRWMWGENRKVETAWEWNSGTSSWDQTDFSFGFDDELHPDTPKLYAIYGIKYAQDCSAEVADIRVGYDGNVYPIAGNAVRKSNADVNLVLVDTFGIVETTISVVGGTAHLSTKDRVRFPVKAGEAIIVNIEKEAPCTIQLFSQGSSSLIGTYHQSWNGMNYRLICPYNSENFGFYIDSETSQDIKIKLMREGSAVRQCSDYAVEQAAYDKDSVRFFVTPGVNHSSSNPADYLMCNLNVGDRFRIYLTTDVELSVNLFDSNGKRWTTNLAKNQWVYFTADASITHFGFYLEAPSDQGVNVTAMVEKVYDEYHHFDDFILSNFPKNLIGPTPGVLYPVPYLRHDRDYVVLSTASGEAVDSNVVFSFYDKNKNLLNTYTLRTTDGASRTVKPYEGTCFISKSNSAEVQFEIANSATSYEEHVDTEYLEALRRGQNLRELIIGQRSYNVTQGVAHSSTFDRLDINIPEGTEYYILAMCNTYAVRYITVYETGGATHTLHLNEPLKLTASLDIKRLGFYNDAALETDEIFIYVYKATSPLAYDREQYDFVNSVAANVDVETASNSFTTAISGLSDTEQFLFFTDPHVFPHDVNEASMEKAIGVVEKAYNNTPTSFVLCGGDWLQSYDTKAEAAYKLGRIDGIMRAKFGNRYYPILGNHDTNYQGASHQQTNYDFTDMISNDSLRQLWFREYGANYYDFLATGGTRFYVFDTQLDWYASMDDYKWQQCNWFANKLLSNDDIHSVITLHIVKNTADGEVLPFATQLTLIAQAYNSKTTVSVNGTIYDFSSTNGKVAFMLGGHLHADQTGVANNIPWVITTNMTYTSRFDLCLIDYDNAKFKMFRVGDGSDREINIVA